MGCRGAHVHVERSGALHAAAFAARLIAGDPLCYLRRRSILLESIGIEHEVPRGLPPAGVLQRMLVFEQILVHSPCMGMGMDLLQWEMPKDEGQLAAACIL